MKQKTKSLNNLVTKDFFKGELKRELKKFATKDDLKRFATKNDFSDFKIEIFAELSKAELKALDREQSYHSEVMTQFDKVIKKLETMSQENTISEFRQDQRLEDHEGRIKVLGSSQKS